MVEKNKNIHFTGPFLFVHFNVTFRNGVSDLSAVRALLGEKKSNDNHGRVKCQTHEVLS